MGSSITIPPLLDPAKALAASTLTQVPRTLADIDASMQAARLASPELSALTTSPSSTTSIYRLLERSVAAAIWVFEGMLTRFQADIAELVHGAPVGTLKWYVDRALEFQENTNLTDLKAQDNRVQYVPVDTSKRIITRAAAVETGNKVTLKVAQALGTAGALQPLSNAQRQQVLAYFDRLRPAGIQMEVVSGPADRLRVEGSVYFNPLLNEQDARQGVEAAIAGYLAALPFNGLLLVSRLEDAIQAVPGVTDVSLTNVQARVGAKLEAAFTRAYYAKAGYVVPEDDANDAPNLLKNSIKYYPQDGTTII